MTCSCIHHLVNPWQRKVVFGVGQVEISEVDADSPLAILLLHQDRVGEPFWVTRLSNELAWSNRSTSSLRA